MAHWPLILSMLAMYSLDLPHCFFHLQICLPFLCCQKVFSGSCLVLVCILLMVNGTLAINIFHFNYIIRFFIITIYFFQFFFFFIEVRSFSAVATFSWCIGQSHFLFHHFSIFLFFSSVFTWLSGVSFSVVASL